VVDLVFSDRFVGGVDGGREQLRVGHSAHLAPERAVGRERQGSVRAGGDDADYEPLRPRREGCVVLLEHLLRRRGSGHHQTWLLTCSTTIPSSSSTHHNIKLTQKLDQRQESAFTNLIGGT
jgi:hypothetical protein